MDMLDLLISHGADIHTIYLNETPLQYATNVYFGYHCDRNIYRYAARFLELILRELSTQTEIWTGENISNRCDAIGLPQIARLGSGSALGNFPPDLIAYILERMKQGIPPSMASAALNALEERHGRLPILDRDLPSFYHHVRFCDPISATRQALICSLDVMYKAIDDSQDRYAELL